MLIRKGDFFPLDVNFLQRPKTTVNRKTVCLSVLMLCSLYKKRALYAEEYGSPPDTTMLFWFDQLSTLQSTCVADI